MDRQAFDRGQQSEPEEFERETPEREEVVAFAQERTDLSREPDRAFSPPSEEAADADVKEESEPAKDSKPARKGKAPRRKPAAAKSAAAKPRRAEASTTAKKPTRRGTRGGGKKKGTAAPPQSKSDAASRLSDDGSTASESKSAARPRRVGADKHLADDEPVAHEPVRRPRSVRDLDHIPDDFD
jgi:hypothetical protein